MIGIVSYPLIENGEQYCYLNAEAGHTLAFCHLEDFPENEIGLKILLQGELVAFELAAIQTENQRAPRAANVKLRSPRKRIDANSHREIGTVTQIGPYGDHCFLQRPKGRPQDCVILHYRNAEKRARPTFEIGQRWEYSVRPPDRPTKKARRWQAYNALLVPAVEITEDNWAAAL